ncbi:MAG: Fe-S cluster assembly protein SufD [Pseudomonadota bacterium]
MNTAPEWLTTYFGQQEAAQDWLRATQTSQRESFLQRGFPVRQEERWKYTDISFLTKKIFTVAEHNALDITATLHKLRIANVTSIFVVLLNGKFSAELSDLTLLPTSVVLTSLASAFQTHADYIEPRLPHDSKSYPFATLNSALVSDGVFLLVPDNVRVTVPIHILHINTANQNFLASPRNIVIAGVSSSVTILEEHHGLDESNYFTNLVTDIEAGDNCHVDFHKIQHESMQAAHIAQIFITARQDAVVNVHTLALGAHLGRDDVTVNLSARGAACQLNGFYYLNTDHQQIDNHILIEHSAPYCVSEMLYKGIADKKSKVIFNGKIHVHKDAQKTQSHQYNHNLLLSADAEINTKPELEIYADDVKCAHGDTVGQIDAAALFYLRARGIPQAIAMKMLTQAFAADVFAKITCQAVKQKMADLLNEKFAHDN